MPLHRLIWIYIVPEQTLYLSPHLSPAVTVYDVVAGRDEWELARTWCVKQSADEEMLVSDLVLLSGKRSLSNLWSGTFFFLVCLISLRTCLFTGRPKKGLFSLRRFIEQCFLKAQS